MTVTTADALAGIEHRDQEQPIRQPALPVRLPAGYVPVYETTDQEGGTVWTACLPSPLGRFGNVSVLSIDRGAVDAVAAALGHDRTLTVFEGQTIGLATDDVDELVRAVRYCRECSHPFDIERKRGRPPVRCYDCRGVPDPLAGRLTTQPTDELAAIRRRAQGRKEA